MKKISNRKRESKKKKVTQVETEIMKFKKVALPMARVHRKGTSDPKRTLARHDEFAW